MLGLIGKGRVGTALSNHLEMQVIVATPEENYKLPQLLESCDTIFLTVPDRYIAQVAKDIATSGLSLVGKTFFHCSGSMTLECLQSLQEQGAHIGSVHPLQSFATGQEKFAGVYMAVDGDAEGKQLGQEIVARLGAHMILVPTEERALYHAAACVASNYLVTVVDLAQRLMSRWTGDDRAALEALLPLIDGTVHNLHSAKKAGQVLTGPIARGDGNTLEKHLQVLPEDALELYRTLGQATVAMALREELIKQEDAEIMEEIL